jgi:two-component system cell cycle sensor histidine kinase/response regulator CckA
MPEAMNTTPRILIVANEPDVIAVTARACTAAGYDVLQARSGTEGMTTALREIPELVILDVDLEDEDGVEICRRIAAAPTLRNVSVVMATDRRLSEEEATHVLDAGAVEWFRRPVHGEELISRLRTLLRLQEAEARLNETQGFLETVLDQSPFPMWIGDAEGTLIRTSQALREALNLTDEQLVGIYNPLRDPNLVREGLSETIRSVIEHHEPARFTMLWRPVEFGGESYQDGQDRHVDLAMYPVVRDGQLQNIVTQWQDVTAHVEAKESLRRAHELSERLIEDGPVGIVKVNSGGEIVFANRHAEELFGLEKSAIHGRSYDAPVWKITAIDGSHFPDEELPFRRVMASGRAVYDVQHAIVRKNGARSILSINGAPVHDDQGHIEGVVFALLDITLRAEHEAHMREIAWLLDKQSDTTWEPRLPDYGDVTQLNTERTIRDSIGPERLKAISADLMKLLDTSVAVYEKNGDYAYGCFVSEWCSLMDGASRRLCDTDSNSEALSCGRWLCHENCWNQSAKTAIESGRPTDIACVGGIRLYGVPIRADNEIVGAINVGYGNPPSDDRSLRELAEKFGTDVETLREAAHAFKPRPEFITEAAKARLSLVAQQVGQMVEIQRAQESLRESEQRLRLAMESASEGFWEWDFTTGLVTFDDVALRMLGYDADDVTPQPGEWWISQIHVEDRPSIEEAFAAFVGGERPTYTVEFRLATRGGAYVWVSSTARIVRRDDHGKPLLVVGIHRDITQAKQSENRLREAEAELRAVLDSTPFPVAVVDSDDHAIHYWSQSAGALFGHTATTTLDWYEIAYPDPAYREAVIRRWKQALAVARDEDRPVNAGEYQVTCADGSTRLCELHAAFVRESLVVTFRDVTDQREMERAQKAAEEALRQSEHRFQLAMDASQDGLFDWNLLTNEIYYSPGWKSMLGYADDELPNDFSVWESTTDPDDVERCWAMQQDLIHGRRDRFEIEFTMKHKDGHWVDILSRANAVFDDNGRAVRIVGTHVDISDLKDAEAALRESEAKYRSLFETSVAPILNTLSDGTIEAANPACEDLFGFERRGLVGASILDFYANPEDRIEFERTLAEEGSVKDYPIPFKKKDGTLIHCLASVSAHRSEDGGAIHGFRGTLRDVTREQELQKQLTQAQKLESVGRLAGGVAHDFNNMLGVILGHADWILQKTGSDLPYREGLMEIRTAAERSANLTRQLLAFARKQTVSPKVIDLNTTIEDMLKMLRRLIGEDIDMAWIPGGKLWQLKIDPGQIDQIMANLCVNARDAIRGVGKVTIESRNARFDEDYCRDHAGFAPGEYVMLAVSDNGCGMDAETLSHVFEPFFTTKNLGEGTGLGLATVYGVVKQNNGFINVYSEPGQGTTFKIYLPRHTVAPTPRPKTDLDELRKHGSETVLLVEDEPAILRMTTMMLEEQGYTVLSASSPGEAVRLATDHVGEIHLLVTDVVMPEMNGRDLAELILSLHPDLKYLFMSGYTANVIVHHGVLDEGVSFIQKPFSSRDLAVKVRQVLDRG